MEFHSGISNIPESTFRSMECSYFYKNHTICQDVKIMVCPVQKMTLSEILKFHIFTLKKVEIFI